MWLGGGDRPIVDLLHAAGLPYRLIPNTVGWWLLRRPFFSACLPCRLVPISDARWLLCEELEENVQSPLFFTAGLTDRLVPNSVCWWLLCGSFRSACLS
jgi:hypothetical protein